MDVLRDLRADEAALRVLELPRCRNRKLGATRKISVNAADGEYIVLHVDGDNAFEDGITDVVEVFQALEDHIEKDF